MTMLKNDILKQLHKINNLPDDELRRAIKDLALRLENDLEKVEANRQREIERREAYGRYFEAHRTEVYELAKSLCPPGFSIMNSLRGASWQYERDVVLIEANSEFKNHLLVITKVPETDANDWPLHERGAYFVYGKDIGVPAYERIGGPDGFAVVLTKAGKAAKRKIDHATAISVAG